MNVTILRFFSLIPDVLLRLRHERGESQLAVATRAGLSDKQLSKYERQQVVPDIATLLQLLHAYEQQLVIMPALIAETLPERDAVVAAAARWWDSAPRPHNDRETGELLDAVRHLVAAELRHRGGAHARLVEPKAADR